MKRERITVRHKKIGSAVIVIATPEKIRLSEIRPSLELSNAKGKQSQAKKVRSAEKTKKCDNANSYSMDKSLIKQRRNEKHERYLLRKEAYLNGNITF